MSNSTIKFENEVQVFKDGKLINVSKNQAMFDIKKHIKQSIGGSAPALDTITKMVFRSSGGILVVDTSLNAAESPGVSPLTQEVVFTGNYTNSSGSIKTISMLQLTTATDVIYFQLSGQQFSALSVGDGEGVEVVWTVRVV